MLKKNHLASDIGNAVLEEGWPSLSVHRRIHLSVAGEQICGRGLAKREGWAQGRANLRQN